MMFKTGDKVVVVRDLKGGNPITFIGTVQSARVGDEDEYGFGHRGRVWVNDVSYCATTGAEFPKRTQGCGSRILPLKALNSNAGNDLLAQWAGEVNKPEAPPLNTRLWVWAGPEANGFVRYSAGKMRGDSVLYIDNGATSADVDYKVKMRGEQPVDWDNPDGRYCSTAENWRVI